MKILKVFVRGLKNLTAAVLAISMGVVALGLVALPLISWVLVQADMLPLMVMWPVTFVWAVSVVYICEVE